MRELKKTKTLDLVNIIFAKDHFLLSKVLVSISVYGLVWNEGTERLLIGFLFRKNISQQEPIIITSRRLFSRGKILNLKQINLQSISKKRGVVIWID